jgi:tetratricopeptide (TPR) repeat protein
MKKLFLIFVFLVSITGVAQENALFEQGKELYKAEKYQEAAEKWKQILNDGQHSAALYYNLGNAHYKLNHIGPSVYYYEKALQLAPNDNDIKNNLSFAENARIDAIEPLPETIFKRWYKNISGIFSYEGWAILTTIFSMLFVVLFLLYYFSVAERRKRLLFAGSLLSVVFLLGTLVLAFKTYDDFSNNQPAIIFSESVEVKSAPTLGSDPAFVLHEGTKVQILQRDGEWFEILLADGKDGWIPASDLKEL